MSDSDDDARRKVDEDFERLLATIRKMAAEYEARVPPQHGGIEAEIRSCESRAKHEAETDKDAYWRNIYWFKLGELRSTYRRRLAMVQFEDIESGRQPSKQIRRQRQQCINDADLEKLLAAIKEAKENCRTTLEDIENYASKGNSTLAYPNPKKSQTAVKTELAELDDLEHQITESKA